MVLNKRAWLGNVGISLKGDFLCNGWYHLSIDATAKHANVTDDVIIIGWFYREFFVRLSKKIYSVLIKG